MIGTYPGLYEGLQIHRNVDPLLWRKAVDALPEELREGAEKYLRPLIERDAMLKRYARECGCRTMEEFEKLKREARQHKAPGARAWVRAGRPDQWRTGDTW